MLLVWFGEVTCLDVPSEKHGSEIFNSRSAVWVGESHLIKLPNSYAAQSKQDLLYLLQCLGAFSYSFQGLSLGIWDGLQDICI
jgi:hypothetical protein